MTVRARLVPILLCFLIASSTVGQEELAVSPEDFAFGRLIEPVSGAALQRLTLDMAVYRGSVGSALSDLRVFNASGRAVSHAILHSKPEQVMPEERREVPYFVVPASNQNPSEQESYPALLRSIGVETELSGDGVVLRLKPSDPAKLENSKLQYAREYLLDMGTIDQPVSRVEVVFEANVVNFMAAMHVSTSRDLEHFETVKTRAAIAVLEQGGHRIKQTSIPLPVSQYQYVRLRWLGAVPAARLLSISAVLSPETVPNPRSQQRLSGKPISDRVGEFLYDMKGSVPADSAQIHLSQANSVVKANLYSSFASEGPWRQHFSGLLYQLEQAETLRNAEIRLRLNRDRYFKLVVLNDTAGVGGEAPDLEVTWLPEELIFVAQGDAPFTLAYGSANVSDASFNAKELFASAGGEKGILPTEQAKLKPEFELGGEAALVAKKPPTATSTYVLWFILLLAVGIVLLLSFRLLRSMKSSA